MSFTQILKFIFNVSRPRFALYIVGVYIVGFAYGVSDYSRFLSFDFLFHLLFFLIPGNIFLYGVNDYFDADTDQFNEKKQDKETFVAKKSTERTVLFWLLVISLMTGILLMGFQQDMTATLILGLFLALCFFYSAPPTRFKAHPFIDSISNVLYIVPGVLGYYHVTGMIPETQPLLALALWTWAMHLFSAVPDIESDARADLKTTAVTLGKKQSLLLCASLWLLFALLISISLSEYQPWIFAAWIYPLFAFYVYVRSEHISIDRVYWIYPYLNVMMGAGAFFIVLFL